MKNGRFSLANSVRARQIENFPERREVHRGNWDIRCVKNDSTSRAYRPTLGGVETIDKSKQIITKPANEAATNIA
jgi:hypothetical protein